MTQKPTADGGDKGGNTLLYIYHAVITFTYELPSELATRTFIWNGPVKQ